GDLRKAFRRPRWQDPRDPRDRLAVRLGAAREPAKAAAPRVGADTPRRCAGDKGNRGRREAGRLERFSAHARERHPVLWLWIPAFAGMRGNIHCGSMPASLISLPQVTSSDCTKAASVSGGPENASNPVTAIFAFESGSAMILATSSFNRATISGGVPAGANRPAHEVTS